MHRIQTIALLTSIMSFSLLGCAERAAAPLETVAEHRSIDVARLYAERRASTTSVGYRHNQGLATVLNRMKQKRAAQARRLLRHERCAIILDVVFEVIAPEEVRHIASHEQTNPKFDCEIEDLRRRAERASLHAATVSFDSQVEWDMVDSVWADDSYWNTPDTYPTLADDLSFLDAWGASLEAAVDGASSPAAAQAAIVSLVQSQSVSDTLYASYVVESAVVASSSIEYWEENWEEWLDQFCDEPSEQMRGTAIVDIEEYCDGERGGGGGGGGDILASYDPTDFITGVAKADIKGYIEMGRSVYSGYQNVFGDAKKAARQMPMGKTLTRYLMPSTRTIVIQGAKLVGRFNVLGLVGGTLLDSAIELNH